MENQPQTISEVTPTYIIKAGYQFKILHIQLKLLYEKSAKLFQITLSDENLSMELKLLFGDAQTIFFCLFNRQTYDVLPEAAQIVVKMPHQVGSQERKTCLLNLEQTKADRQELTSSIIRDLAAQVQITKNNHVSEFQKMKQTFTKKIRKQKENITVLEKQNSRMKRMIRQMNKMIRQIIKIKRKVNGFQEEGTDPLFIPEDSDDEKLEKRQNQQINEVSIPVDLDSKHLKKFTVNQNNIRYQSQEHEFTQILMSTIIPFGRVYKFSFRITNSKNNKIMIGITYKNRIRKRSSFNSGEALCYYGYNGWVCDGKNHETYNKKGNGFKTGQTVTVTVDLEKGFMQWDVDNRKMADHQNEKIRRNKVEYVPYVEMHDTGDIVRWLN